MKPSPQKSGTGHISAYRLIIGSAAARRCGFVLENGERLELETIEKPEDNAVLIRVKKPEKYFILFPI